MLDFQQHQQAFFNHIRDPINQPLPDGIENRRMRIYRELFFNNILGFLENGFPVLKSLYTEDDWQQLARQFFIHHQCASPYFVEISREFVEFLQSDYQATDNDPPFMLELAHYEWLELDISIRQVESKITFWDRAPFSKVQFSPLATLVSYQFPVHQISVSFQPQAHQEYSYLVVYRNVDDEVKFTQVNMLTAQLLMVIQQHAFCSLTTVFESLQQALPDMPHNQLENGVKDIVHNLLKQQVLLPA